MELFGNIANLQTKSKQLVSRWKFPGFLQSFKAKGIAFEGRMAGQSLQNKHTILITKIDKTVRGVNCAPWLGSRIEDQWKVTEECLLSFREQFPGLLQLCWIRLVELCFVSRRQVPNQGCLLLVFLLRMYALCLQCKTDTPRKHNLHHKACHPRLDKIQKPFANHGTSM